MEYFQKFPKIADCPLLYLADRILRSSELSELEARRCVMAEINGWSNKENSHQFVKAQEKIRKVHEKHDYWEGDRSDIDKILTNLRTQLAELVENNDVSIDTDDELTRGEVLGMRVALEVIKSITDIEVPEDGVERKIADALYRKTNNDDPQEVE